jgi:hypothetical protein
MIADPGEMKSNDLQFVMPNGDTIMTLIDQFDTFLSHVGLPIAPTGKVHALQFEALLCRSLAGTS